MYIWQITVNNDKTVQTNTDAPQANIQKDAYINLH